MEGYGNCGLSPCVDFSENFYGYTGLGIGSAIVSLAGEGFLFFAILAAIEMKLWQKVKRFIFEHRDALPSQITQHLHLPGQITKYRKKFKRNGLLYLHYY